MQQPPPPPPLPPSLRTAAQFLSDHSECEYSACTVNEDLERTRLSPKEVAEEISHQFKNCLPHTKGQSELHRAAFEGDAVRLQLLLDQIISDPSRFDMINQRNRLGCTPIRLAATGGHLECLTSLINVGANIDTVDVKCQTPLFVAVKNRRLDCARKLLQSGACPDGDTGNSSTPLYIAFMNGDVRYVLLLLEHGADPDKLRHTPRVSHNVYKSKLTSLDAAIEYLVRPEDIHDAVKALLIRGCKTDNFQYHTCVYHDRSHLIDLLYSFGVNSDGRDLNNRLATELNLRNFTKKKLIYLRERPRSLISACRIAIVSCLPKPRRNLDALSSLPLPSALISYLQFSDV